MDGAALLQEVPVWVESAEACLSRFRDNSELSFVNKRSGLKTSISEMFLDVLLVALDVAQDTDSICTPLILPALMASGYDRSFDQLQTSTSTAASGKRFALQTPNWQDIEIFIDEHAVCLPPGAQVDLGGVGKGWTAEFVADRLEEYGPCLVDAGGDIVARGIPQHQTGWHVNVADPISVSEQPLITLILTNQAIATSGIDFRRWLLAGKSQHHLIDPRTGKPADTDVLSATVVHGDVDRAESYARLLVILGSEAGLSWFEEYGSGCAIVMCQDGTVLATPNLQSLAMLPQTGGQMMKENYS